jgi:hypothetical protein
MLKYKKTQPISDLIDQVYPNFPLAEAIKKATIRSNLHPHNNNLFRRQPLTRTSLKSLLDGVTAQPIGRVAL